MTVVSKGEFWPIEVDGRTVEQYVQSAQRKRPLDEVAVRKTIWTLPHSYVFFVAGVAVALLDVLLILAYLLGRTGSSGGDGTFSRAVKLFLPTKDFPHAGMHRFELATLFLMAFLVNAGFCVVGVATNLPPAARPDGLSRFLAEFFCLATVTLLVLTIHALLRWVRVRSSWLLPLAFALAGGFIALALILASSRLAALRDPDGGVRIVYFMFFIERARNLDSGVSLLWMALLLGIGQAMWNLGHLRQVRIVEDAAILRRVGVLPRRGASARADTAAKPVLDRMGLAGPMRAVVEEAEGVLPSPLAAVLMILVFSIGLWISRGLVFFEKPVLGRICAGAYALLLALIVFGCARYFRTWKKLEEVLARTAPLPVITAMKRIPGELLTSFKRPWDACVVEVWHRHCRAVFAAVRSDADLKTKWSAALDVEPNDLDELLAEPVAYQIEESSTGAAAVPADAKVLRKKWEEFLAMRFVAFIQYIRTHLANFVGVTTAALLPALWATNFYPLRQNRFLLMLVLGVTAFAMSVATFVFVQMNRNYVLSRLAGTAPGKVTWDRSFVTSILVHVAIPVLALLAVKFPELGRAWGALIATVSLFGGGGN